MNDSDNKAANFIVVQDSLNLWHWRIVNGADKELYTSANSFIDKDTAIMIGQSYGHNYIGD